MTRFVVTAIGLVLILAAGIGIGWSLRPSTPSAPQAAETHDHAHNDSSELTLSSQARRNLGLKTGPVAIGEFWDSITIPATVVEQPGHSHLKVTAPLTGMVKQLFVHPSQLVRPGDPIAELELTGDALATTQGDLLQLTRELEVNQEELARVEQLVAGGSLPERNKLQLQYDRRRLEAQRESKIQQLLVLGVSQEQVESIQTSRKLIRTFQVRAPEVAAEIKSHHEGASVEKTDKPHPTPDWSYTVESIDVFIGKRVQIGDEICSLAFHVMLYLEGQAFEKEAPLISQAMKERWPVTARFESVLEPALDRSGLHILFVDNVIDPASRTVRFFLTLPNEVVFDNQGPQGETYRTWLFKPGQKASLDVPRQRLEDVIVVPSDAVVRDGAEAFVFRVNGDKLERQRVAIAARGGGRIALANDGSIFPGEELAMNNAYQLHLAVKKASEGESTGHDHHGHSH